MGTSPVPGTWVHRSRPDAGNQWYGLVVWVSWGWPGTKVGWELGFARAHLETGPAGASLVLVWAISLGLWDGTGAEGGFGACEPAHGGQPGAGVSRQPGFTGASLEANSAEASLALGPVASLGL